jgi:hypothetical protein
MTSSTAREQQWQKILGCSKYVDRLAARFTCAGTCGVVFTSLTMYKQLMPTSTRHVVHGKKQDALATTQ